MIPFDFVYIKPDTIAQAVEAYLEFSRAGKTALYYAGGSEIISMCRMGEIRPDAVIDIKDLPELHVLSIDEAGLTLGAALTLNQIKESKLFPLMSLACGRIADHTNQCRITLGGNLCGTIVYRETSLPLWISDAEVAFIGPDGPRTALFADAFHGRMRRMRGELLVSVRVPAWALTATHAHIKHPAHEKIDYPLVNVTAIQKDRNIRAAFSGLSSEPIRNAEVEEILSAREADAAARAAEVLAPFAHSDAEGSAEYRLFVLKNTLEKLLEGWS